MEYLHKLSESNETLKKVVIYAAEKQYEEPIKFQPKLERSPGGCILFISLLRQS